MFARFGVQTLVWPFVIKRMKRRGFFYDAVYKFLTLYAVFREQASAGIGFVQPTTSINS